MGLDDGGMVGQVGGLPSSATVHPSGKQITHLPRDRKLHPVTYSWRQLQLKCHPDGCCRTLMHPLQLQGATQAMCCFREGTELLLPVTNHIFLLLFCTSTLTLLSVAFSFAALQAHRMQQCFTMTECTWPVLWPYVEEPRWEQRACTLIATGRKRSSLKNENT